MTTPCGVLAISGSLRAGSTNTAVLRTAQVIAPATIVLDWYGGLTRLPHFNPDEDVEPLHPAVAGLRDDIRNADALLFSTPEYAGALPGSFKNLLDWTVGDDHVRSIYKKPVAWINASSSPTGAADAHESLRKVLGYTHAAIVEAACVHIPVVRHAVGADGLIAEPSIRTRIARSLSTLVDFVHQL